ncbi:DUF937 domain-containing protein [Ramlibacter sp. USB13]|uniref:DUF937 domain-containing protein n=1 Tax=Ramlibacter cellulosilyticus TaxID=2764187 RepID=A0A923MQQ2_9BURK|nr:YidB family protein [Ramlibacter cellulosilyticus]MBC5782092.1 DUF937 domain-containing protein [Ramlibacter cellulosilyticus]
MNYNNPLLGQVLGGLFGQALGRRRVGGGLGGGGLGGALGGIALGSVLAGAMRNRGRAAGVPVGVPGGANPYGNRTALLVMLLPLAMRWVQKNGGMGAVLDRFKQQGFGRQAQSWVDTGDNDGIDERAVEQVVGQGELQQMAQRLGVPEHEVAQAFAEIMPQMVDKLTPDGQVPREADEVLDESRNALEKEIQDVEYREKSVS